MDERLYWIGFNLVKGIGAARLRLLLSHFGDAASAWQASTQELRAAGLSPRLAEAVLQTRDSGRLEQTIQRLQDGQISILTWDDPGYPRPLLQIDQPPPVLYLRGDLQPTDDLALAVVGTRRITAYGRQVAEQVGTFLAQQRVTLVSGLARGVDAVAHQAALNGGGRTLAVLGCGVDVIYPPENRRLAEQIVASGALLSDYPPATQPEAANFPPRNRIISGLARAVVVVEAGATSGALITADFARQQKRPVFAVPGNINAAQSQGTNRLIQQGHARPLLALNDLLNELELEKAAEQQTARASLPADDLEAQLYQLLNSQPQHIDEIHLRAGLPIAQVSSLLAMLELKGLAQHVGGMQYVAIREEGALYQ